MNALEKAPAHWTRTTIGDIAQVRLGRQRSPKNHSGDHMRPYLRAANVDWYGLRPDDVQEMNFTHDEMKTYALREDDILLVEGSGSAAEVGKCGLVPERFVGHAFQNTLIRVRSGDNVDARWLMYRINAEAELGGFLALARGSGIFHLGSRRMGNWPIAVPPFDEQRRIAEQLARLLSMQKAAMEDLERSESKVRALRLAAMSRVLEPGRRSEWPTSNISGVADVRLGRQRSPSNHLGDNMRPYLRAANVTWYRLRLDDVNTMDFADSEMEAYALAIGDILTVEGGTPEDVGKCALVAPAVVGYAFQNTLLRVRPREGIDSKWLMFRLNLDGELGRYRPIARGAGNIQHLSATRYKSHQLMVPPIETQRAMVRQVEATMSLSRRLQADLSAVQAQGVALHRSVLQAAIEGRLIHRDAPAVTSHDEFEETLA